MADGNNRPWKLFNLNQDPTEQEDVSKRFPERAAILKKLWEDWAELPAIGNWLETTIQ